MIELTIPVDSIPYIRTIEGRKYKDGKWQFPESAANKLIQLGLLSSDDKPKEREETEFELSPFLYDYQKKIVNTALNCGSYGIFSETGTGKTLMALEIAAHYDNVLILCPLSVIETAWIDDCHKFYPDMSIVSVWADSREGRRKLLWQPSHIKVMNYDTFKILRYEISNFGFDCMIVDESSVMKNMNAQITSAIMQMMFAVPHKFVLSGCPTPNHNSEIFPQMKFVDSEVFGNNYYGFLARYFHQDMANPHRWYQTDEDKERYFSRLSEKSVFLRKDECLDLPDKVFEVRRFNLSDEQQSAYDSFVSDIRTHINEWSKFEFTAKLMKLREIASGFIIQKDQSVVDFLSSKKALLKSVLEEIGNQPVVVWCQFTHEIETLAAEFGGAGLTSATQNRDEIIRDFKDGRINLLFANPKMVGKGLTFTNCTYCVYYSLSYSYEDFKQSQDRIHRIGQGSKCTYIVLQAQDTIEERIYSCLQRKGNAVDELYLEMGAKTNGNH